MPDSLVREAAVPAGRSAAVARAADLASAIYLVALIAFVARHMWSSLFRVWFFSSDEYVFAAEVIRFLNLDFHQHFFDMPGTPLMFVSAAAWSLVYAVQTGLSSPVALDDFTFQHLPELFVLIRVVTLACYCLSVPLMFVVASRLMNRAAGWTAALILAMSPTYATYSSFVRVESLCICLMLLAILIVLRVTDRRGASTPQESSALWDWVFVAGVLAGLAAATRLHSITALLPVLTLMLLMHPVSPRTDYPRWTKVLVAVSAVAIAVALTVVFLARQTFEPYPSARQLISSLLIAGAGTLALGIVLYRWSGLRKPLVRIASPEVIRLLFGCVVGFLVGTPTILGQYRFFFGSINMYSTTYRDWAREGMPFWEHLNWYVRYYMQVFVPDTVVLALLTLGTIVILIRRDRRLLPFLVGAVFFFVSKPISLVPSPHHVIPWLPFYAIVCSYPVAVVWDAVSHRLRYGAVLAPAVFVALFPALWLTMTKGPAKVETITPVVEERLANVQRATDWIKRNTEPGSTIAVSYFCFNPDVFYRWLGYLEVPVARSVFDGRDYLIWWGHARSISGKTGYACATPGDVVSMKTKLDLSEPGQGTDPYTDQRFQVVQSFGSGLAEVNVFRFDYRQ